MALDLKDRARWAEEALRALADAERRRATAGYFPTEMEILGVSAPKMRSVLSQLSKDLEAHPPQRALELAWLLRKQGTHEGRQIAFELLERRADARVLLRATDVRRLGEGNDNWASVDAFSCYISGPLWRDGHLPDGEVLRWTRSKDVWWRRTALVSTVPLNLKSRGGRGDPGRTLMACRELVGDSEPMVQKGLSWALRALVPVDREVVQGFLEEHESSLPSLVKREVGNKLRTGKKNPGRRPRSNPEQAKDS